MVFELRQSTIWQKNRWRHFGNIKSNSVEFGKEGDIVLLVPRLRPAKLSESIVPAPGIECFSSRTLLEENKWNLSADKDTILTIQLGRKRRFVGQILKNYAMSKTCPY